MMLCALRTCCKSAAGPIFLQAYKTFGNRVMTVWKKFEEQRAAIQAAIESPTDDVGISSSSSVDHDVDDKDGNLLDDDDDAGVDDSNDPLPYIGPAFIDEPLNDEDICKLSRLLCKRLPHSFRLCVCVLEL